MSSSHPPPVADAKIQCYNMSMVEITEVSLSRPLRTVDKGTNFYTYNAAIYAYDVAVDLLVRSKPTTVSGVLSSADHPVSSNMRARWYDTQSGVFTSVDPAVSSTNQPYQFANGDPVNNSDPSGMYTQSCPSQGDVSGIFTCVAEEPVSGFQGGWVYTPVYAQANEGAFKGTLLDVLGQVEYALQQTFVNVYQDGNQSATVTGYADIGGAQVPLNAYFSSGPPVTNFTLFEELYFATALEFDARGIPPYVDNTMGFIFAQSSGAAQYTNAASRADIIDTVGQLAEWALATYTAIAVTGYPSPSGAPPTTGCVTT